MTKIGQKLIRILGALSLDIPLRGLSGVLLGGAVSGPGWAVASLHTLRSTAYHFSQLSRSPLPEVPNMVLLYRPSYFLDNLPPSPSGWLIGFKTNSCCFIRWENGSFTNCSRLDEAIILSFPISNAEKRLFRNSGSRFGIIIIPLDNHLRFWALNSPKRDLYNFTRQRAHRKLQKQGGHFQTSVDFQVKNSGSGVLHSYTLTIMVILNYKTQQ